ncbi:MAG: hypothetical protein SAK29_32005 [Scytonema sp. PMC 1069.18]|nr:hypothetical protein [Scytonema sp. PMC 1069.18]MEC4884063.1 hypothetical protein [Scytonema sp. PMC 1070.18]
MVLTYRNGDDSFQIEDYTQKFTQSDLEQLGDFVCNELLSTPVDVSWLGVIRIQDKGGNGVLGSWSAEFYKNKQNPSQIDSISTLIILNYAYHDISGTLTSLDQLKETLAHEYGHHWTLLYCILNHGLLIECMDDVFTHRLPDAYYRIRDLNYQEYYPSYSPGGWHRCDKEIVAEDYRVLFAPYPYNQEHKIVTHPKINTLAFPNEETKEYIATLHHQL